MIGTNVTIKTYIIAAVAKVKEVITKRLTHELAAAGQPTFLAAARHGYLETKGGRLAIVPIISRPAR